MGALIWLASYPKSGNTWMRAFLANLLIDSPTPVDINQLSRFCPTESGRSLYQRYFKEPLESVAISDITALRPRVQKALAENNKGPVFLKTHNYMGAWFDTPFHNLEVLGAAIYIVRNPLDIAISAADHFGISIDEAIKRLSTLGMGTNLTKTHIPEVHNTWSIHVDSWALHPNPRLLVLRYEDLLRSPDQHFQRVLDFLKINLPEERFQRALQRSSFSSLKAQETATGFSEKSKLSERFFREGKADVWREKLTPDQVRQVINDHHAAMVRYDYIPADYA